MNRIRLRVFNPPDEPVDTTEDCMDMDRPHILSFRQQTRATVISGRYTPPADRARVIRDNSVCPECSMMNVEPLELDDAMVSRRNHRPIPGTATIVGFHCNSCGTEWPVYELTTRQKG